MATNVKDYIPGNLRNQFWVDFADSVSSELQNLKDEISKKKLFFDVSNQNDKTELIRIAKSLGYTPDLSLDDSLQNIKDNINSIPFRIENKTAYVSYEYIFKTVPYPGEVFILYYEDNKLQRAAISLVGMLEDLGTSDQPYNAPFTYQAEENYSSFLFSQLFLDSGLVLDSSSRPWALDEFTSSSKTNHLAVEYAIERIITVDNTEYLMISDYLSYLFNAVDYTRKVTEVPHVGSQLSLLMDNTGYFDSYSNGSDQYSIPDLKVKCAVIPANYEETNPANQATKLVVGTGTQTLPSVNTDSPDWPDALAEKFGETELVDDETEETTEWKVINSMIQANTVNGEILGTGDGSVASLSGTLSEDNIRPYSVKITFQSSPQTRTIIDDGQGKLFIEGLEDFSVGTIDYETGDYSFDTEKTAEVDLEVLSEVSVSSLDVTLQNTDIEPTSLTVYFKIGETGYIKPDDGAGDFNTGSGLSAGYLNYSTGDIDLTFTSSVVARESDADEQGNTQGGVTVEYRYTRKFEVDTDSDITARYEVDDTLSITEAGLLDSNDKLLAYATFPAIQMDDVRYHASFQFLIAKFTF